MVPKVSPLDRASQEKGKESSKQTAEFPKMGRRLPRRATALVEENYAVARLRKPEVL